MSGTGELRPDGVPRAAERSPRRGMCAAVLALEAITLGLSTPVMITLSDVAVAPALAVGLGLVVACLLLAGMLRREWAYGAGYAIQVAAVGLGFVVPTMFFLGAIFAALWTTADLLGRRIERERAAAWAAYDARESSGTSEGSAGGPPGPGADGDVGGAGERGTSG